MAEESTPPEAVVVEGVGVVVVDRLVGSIAKPAVADGHCFECIEPLADLRGVSFLTKAFLIQKGEIQDAEEEVIIGMKFGSANGGEPLGDLLFSFLESGSQRNSRAISRANTRAVISTVFWWLS